MKTSQRGLDLIKEFEGFRSDAYQDVVGVWTIGYGFTKNVRPGDTMTRTEAEMRLMKELAEYERAVAEATRGNCTQNQHDALTSFAWNVGVDGMRKSSVIKAHNRGDYQAAARAFGLWNKAGGRVWPGLTRRRAAEAALYLSPEETEAPQEMPQAVEPETKMTQSTINKGAVIAGGVSTITAIQQATEAVAGVKKDLSSLDAWLVPALLLAVVAACGYIIYERVQQRRKGFA